GRPGSGLHALQIEINRDLYLHESRVARSEGFDRLRGQMETLIKGLVEEDIPEIFRQRKTA
ncbi:MAG: hypothetical protein PVI23_15555, partial [Maricaulaceae bacterium]